MNIAVIFPGQGSQSVGMLNAYAVDWPIVTETFAQASDVLGYDLWDVVSNGPEDKLNQTAITQPAMLAAVYYTNGNTSAPGIISIPKDGYVDNINIYCDFDNPPPQPPGGN